MTDSVKIVMEQIDDDTGNPISSVKVEWYGMDRNVANALSMSVADAMVSRVTELSNDKAAGGDQTKPIVSRDYPPGAMR